MKKISFIGIVFSLFTMVSFLSYTPVASAAMAAPTHTYLLEGTVTGYEEGGGDDIVGLKTADRFTGTVTYTDSNIQEFLLTFYDNSNNQITPDFFRWDYQKGFSEVYELNNSVSLTTDREDPTYVGESEAHWMELNFNFGTQVGNIALHGGVYSEEPYYWLSGEITKMSPVPIPSSVWILGTGLLGLVGFRKRKQK